MAEQGEPPEPWLAAAAQAPAPLAAGGGKRPIALVTREELRDLNREKRRKQAEERRGKLLETFKQAKEAAEQEDGWLDRVEAAPIYTPTAKEWADPLAYIRSIAAEAGQYGLCIVRAPVAPSVPGGMALQLSDPGFKFGTRQQALRDRPWKDWQGVTFLPGKRYSLKEFQDAACAAAAKRFGGLHGCLPVRTLEREYWREREKAAGAPVLVEYGNDVDGSLFAEEDRLGATRWNLNSLPSEPGSALRHCDDRGIPGVTRPMLYCGQLFSTFAWHVEDHFMFSVNYQHLGEPKLWYGVPSSDADGFEAVARERAYGPAAEQTKKEGGSEEEVWVHVERALTGKTTMMSPRHLLDAGVQVYRAVQQPGDFVLTFPRSYHAGFGCGFQVGEAVNFATDEWWPFGEDARQRYRRMRQPAIIPHEQLLCEEALALAAERRRSSGEAAEAAAEGGGHQRPGSMIVAALRQEVEPQLQAPGNALAFTFVGAMRRLNHCRAALEAGGAVPLSACPADSPAARQSLHCCVCQQSVYAASAVLHPAGQPDSWRHMCLECATAAAETAAAPSAAVVFVKPCWEALEACARELEPGLQDPADTPLALPLAGTTAEERYGPCHPPGWPSPCQPYSWRLLQQPHTEWPAAVLRLLAPATGGAALAVPTPDAVALAGVVAAGAAVSPEAAFQVALKHEAEQAAAAAAAAEAAEPAAEAAAAAAGAAAAAAAVPAAAAGKRRGRRRGRGQPADEDDADALEALPLESEAAIEVEGHPVQRHIHSDGGEPVLVGSEALEAVLGNARDKKESAAKKLGSWLRKCGSGVSKAKLAGPGRHQAVALLRRQDAAALLGSEELDPERWERLRLFVEGVWPELDAQLAAGTLSRTGGAHGLERQTSAGGKAAPRRRGSGQSGGAGGTEAGAGGQWVGEEEAEISEDTPVSALTGEEQQGGETAHATGATSWGGWEPASKRRRASTTLAAAAGPGAAAGLKQEQRTAAVHAAPGYGVVPVAHHHQHPHQQHQQQQQQQAAQQQQQPGQQDVPALSVEDAAQMLAAAGPDLLAAIMQQGVSLEDPAVIGALAAHLEQALAPRQ